MSNETTRDYYYSSSDYCSGGSSYYGYGSGYGYSNCSYNGLNHMSGFHMFLFLGAIWFVYSFVYIGCMISRRAKLEYASLALFSTGEYLLRANSSVQWVAFLLGLLGSNYIFDVLYTVALVTMMWVTYLLFARWYVLPKKKKTEFLTPRTKLADVAHGKNMFDRGMHHPAFISFLVVFGVGISVLAGFFPWITTIVLIVMSFAIWVTTLVALTNHRQMESQFPGSTKMADVEVQEGNPFVVSHKHLDNVCIQFCAYPQLLVTIILLSSLMLFKSIFLLVSVWTYASVSNALVTVFCFLPDLFYTMLLSSPATVDEFEVSQYKSETTTEEI